MAASGSGSSEPLPASSHPGSKPSQGRILEGTRITLQAKPPYGSDFTIRTAGTPNRWRLMEEELDFCFRNLDAAVASRDQQDSDRKLGIRAEIAVWVLLVYFYWANFGPLTRGTAAVGLGWLIGASMAFSLEIELPLPKGFQLDWSAILTSCPRDFVRSALVLVYGLDPDHILAIRPDLSSRIAPRTSSFHANGSAEFMKQHDWQA